MVESKLTRWPAEGFKPRAAWEIPKDYISEEDPNEDAPAWEPPAEDQRRGHVEQTQALPEFEASDLINRRIQLRRRSLGLDTETTARLCGVSWQNYAFHIESSHQDVFASEVRVLKTVCSVLDLSFFELFDMGCCFCKGQEPFVTGFSLARNELITRRRVEFGLSRSDLGDRVGFYAQAIDELEDDPGTIDFWPLDLIEALAHELELPAQIILAVVCPKCGR